MAIHERQPEYEELRENNGEETRYKKQEAVILKGSNEPTYVVGPSDVWTAENYLCIRTTGGAGSHETEVHKIPHDRIKRREYVVTMDVSEEVATSNLKDTANAEVMD